VLHEMTTILFSTKHESLEVKCQNISQRENLAELFERSSWNHLGIKEKSRLISRSIEADVCHSGL
jgi:hypothetical protein